MLKIEEISSPGFLKCDHCQQPIAFLNASALYGVILLFGQEDGYFGTVCPKCQKTNLRKSKRENCESIKRIFNEMGRTKGFREDVLRYYSIPHRAEDVNDPSDHQIYSTLIDVAE
jgi:phage FluMu protein Com